jgi:hypothetical protein
MVLLASVTVGARNELSKRNENSDFSQIAIFRRLFLVESRANFKLAVHADYIRYVVNGNCVAT